ncbi:MAG: hypothetical protein EBS19_02655 [Spirochaetia bacterium]|nr:hypothetical protein [Spirochaetia bacterium]
MNKTKAIFLILVINIFISCTDANANKIKMDFPVQLLDIASNDPSFYALYFSTREIDSDLTSNCGLASPATTTATGTTGTTGTTTTGTTGTTTTSSKFTIVNSYVMKNTKETMNLRFIYDSTQSRGSVDQQQGFTITGGLFNTTITGKQGTVTWGLGGLGLGYIDESNTGSQQLSYMKNIQLQLNGVFSKNTSTTITTPLTCNTQDNINCTALVTGTTCFTQDNKTCTSASATTGTPITLNITINCESKSVIPN